MISKSVFRAFLMMCVASVVFLQASDAPSASDENLQLVHKLFSLGDQEVLAQYEAFFSDTVRVHSGMEPQGKDITRDEGKKIDEGRMACLSSREWKVLYSFASEDRVVCYLEFHGAHTGEYMGIPATGKEFSLPVMVIYRFQDGKISEVWSSWDKHALLLQISG